MTPQYPTAPPPAPPAPARQAQTQTAAPQAPPRSAPQAPPPHTPPAAPAAPQPPARPAHVGTPAGGPPVASRWGDAQRANTGGTPAPNQRAQVLEDLRQKMHQFVISELGPILYDQRVSEADLRKQVEEQLHKALSQERHALTGPERQNLLQSVFDDVLGYGPIDRLLRDPSITEVMVNGPQKVYVERSGKLQL